MHTTLIRIGSLIAAVALTGVAGLAQAGDTRHRADRPAHTPASLTSPRVAPAVHGPGAHRPYRHVHGPSVRVWFGPPPIYYAPAPYWAYPPYVYRPVPPVVVVPAAPPPVYVERSADPVMLDTPRSGFWYWCESRAAYHPSAPDCPEGWIRVAPQAPTAQ